MQPPTSLRQLALSPNLQWMSSRAPRRKREVTPQQQCATFKGAAATITIVTTLTVDSAAAALAHFDGLLAASKSKDAESAAANSIIITICGWSTRSHSLAPKPVVPAVQFNRSCSSSALSLNRAVRPVQLQSVPIANNNAALHHQRRRVRFNCRPRPQQPRQLTCGADLLPQSRVVLAHAAR